MNESIYEGELRINHDSGTIYFDDGKNGMTLLRISNLPQIPQIKPLEGKILDINFKEKTTSFDPISIEK